MTFRESAALQTLYAIVRGARGTGGIDHTARDAIVAAQTLANTACEMWGHEPKPIRGPKRYGIAICERCGAGLHKKRKAKR